MECIRLTKKGQLTLPQKFMQILNIKEGENIFLDIEEEKVVIKKAPSNPVSDLIGLGKGIFTSSLEYQRKIRDEWEK